MTLVKAISQTLETGIEGSGTDQPVALADALRDGGGWLDVSAFIFFSGACQSATAIDLKLQGKLSENSPIIDIETVSLTGGADVEFFQQDLFIGSFAYVRVLATFTGPATVYTVAK